MDVVLWKGCPVVKVLSHRDRLSHWDGLSYGDVFSCGEELSHGNGVVLWECSIHHQLSLLPRQ